MTIRRTSQFSLSVPVPEHTDADRHAALDHLIQAARDTGLVITGSWITTDGRAAVSWRCADDDTAAALTFQVLAEYAAAEPTEALLFTGYGHHRRDVPLAA